MFMVATNKFNPKFDHFSEQVDDLMLVMQKKYKVPNSYKYREDIEEIMSKKVVGAKKKYCCKNQYDSPILDNLIQKMLSHRPEERPTPVEILRISTFI